MTPSPAPAVVAQLIQYLETAVVPEGLFAPDLFLDLTVPQWRLQAGSAEAALALRASSHPWPGQVRVERVEATASGFTIELEERWDHEDQRWYCREMIRADVVGHTITEMSVYCTGDWDEAQQKAHAADVALIRP